MPDDSSTPDPTPPKAEERAPGQLKFRDDVMPWLSKKKDQLAAEEVEDPLRWDKPAAPKASSSRLPLVIGAIAIAAALAGTVYTIINSNRDQERADPDPQPTPAIFSPDKRSLAWDALNGFLAAKTVEEKLPLVAWPEKVADRMHDYYSRYPDEADQLVGFQLLSSSPRFETDNTYHLAASAEGGEMRLWVLLDEGGSLKIDWECLVAYNPISLEDFIKTPPAAPTALRLTAGKADYYNFGFSDSEFQAYELREQADPDQVLYGYAKLGSEVHLALEDFVVSETPIPLMLELSPPAERGQEVCQIQGLVKPHWSGEE